MVVVYVLRSLKDEKLYIGITDNIEARVKRHNKGQVSSTKKRRPFVLLHTEEFVDYGQARKREKFLKSGPGHRELKKLLAEGRVPTSSR